MRKLFLLFILFCGPLKAQQVVETRPLITVTGEATEKTVPDIIIIHYLVTGKVTPQVAGSFSFTDMDKTDFSLKFVTINDGEIQGSLDMLKNNASFYSLLKEFVITLTDTKKYRDVLLQLIRLDSGEITSIEFRTSKLAAYKENARAKAIEAARVKAESMASVLGQSIGKAYMITEEPSPLINWYDKSQQPGLHHDDDVNDAYLTLPGYISIPAKVTVSFELK
ncbi:MAG TPA: SIMPL domain-containing protein [Bacteroidales bacterium]